MPKTQQQHRKREVIAWTAPPAAIQLKAFPRTRCPHPTGSTAECRRLISFRPTLSDTVPHAGVACAPRPCRSSTMSPSNIASNSNVTCSSPSNRAFAMKPRPSSKGCRSRPCGARELGVQYVLEGSVRRSGDRIRVTAQLIEAASGNHVWAERYDRPLRDVFDVQDEITKEIVEALSVKLTDGERALIFSRSTRN